MSKNNNKLCITIDEKNEIERFILVLNLGFITALENSVMEAEEIEFKLYSPYSIKKLEELEIREEIIELLHKGLFLDDAKKLCSEKSYRESIQEIKQLTLALLDTLPKISEYKHLID